MIFGTKRLIQQYEARIAELHAQIARLERLVFSPTSATKVPLVQAESDAILSGSDAVMEVSESQAKEFEEAMRERDRLLSGQYE